MYVCTMFVEELVFLFGYNTFQLIFSNDKILEKLFNLLHEYF